MKDFYFTTSTYIVCMVAIVLLVSSMNTLYVAIYIEVLIEVYVLFKGVVKLQEFTAAIQ